MAEAAAAEMALPWEARVVDLKEAPGQQKDGFFRIYIAFTQYIIYYTMLDINIFAQYMCRHL